MTTWLEEPLLATLREATGRAGLAYDGRPERLSGGFWADLVAFRLADPPKGLDGDLVARVMPDAAVAAKETVVQRAVAAQGFATPAVRLAGGPDGPLGRAYLVMDLVIGAPLLAGLDGAAALVRLPTLARRLPRVLAAAAAELHALDPEPAAKGLAELEATSRSTGEMLDHLSSIAELLGHADLIAACSAMRARRPTGEPDVVCHGDLHPFNLLIDPSGDYTLLDWSVSMIAPRSFDLAFTKLMLAHPPMAAPAALAGVVDVAGRRLARSFLRQYRVQSGVTVDEAGLAWHTALHALRALTDVAGWAAANMLDQHAGHPWLLVQRDLVAELATVSGVTVHITATG